jgi:two-component system, cell cycle response regulator DivK
MSHKISGTHSRDRVVLLVDDDADCRTVLGFVLEAAGYEVVHASGGAEALGVLATGLRPLAIALDLMMPVIDGNRVLERLRASPELSRIPVVIISASFVGSSCPAGASAALKKPADVDLLLGFLASCELSSAAESA